MAGFNWGSALTKVGEDMPNIGSAVDEMISQKRNLGRQDMLDGKQAKKDERQTILDNMTFEHDKEMFPLKLQGAKQNLAIGQQTLKRNEAMNPLNIEAKKNAAGQEEEKLIAKMSSGIKDQKTFEGFQYALESMGRDPYEFGAKWTPESKQALDLLVRKHRPDAVPGRGGEFTPTLMHEKYNTAANRAKANALIDQYTTDGLIDGAHATSLKFYAEIDPVSVARKLTELTAPKPQKERKPHDRE